MADRTDLDGLADLDREIGEVPERGRLQRGYFTSFHCPFSMRTSTWLRWATPCGPWR